MEHELKSWPYLFEKILSGEKLHEIRTADRAFKEGDILFLKEYDKQFESYTGRWIKAVITYITSFQQPCALSRQALKPGYSILSIQVLEKYAPES